MNPFWISIPDTNLHIRFWSETYDDNHEPIVLSFRLFKPQSDLLVRDQDFITFPWESHLWEIDGFLKWDGCINWKTRDNSYTHGCGPDHIENISKFLTCIYWVGSEYMPVEFDRPSLPDDARIVTLS